jgi:uncharacterized protein YjiS (DUF1127 family)
MVQCTMRFIKTFHFSESDSMNARDERSRTLDHLARARQLQAETLARLPSLLRRGWAALRADLQRSRRRRAALRELYALDNRMLDDIGLSRDLIPFVVDCLIAIEDSPREARPLPTLAEVVALARRRQAPGEIPKLDRAA